MANLLLMMEEQLTEARLLLLGTFLLCMALLSMMEEYFAKVCARAA